MIILRRVVGESMRPTLLPGRLVLALPLRWGVRPGAVVIVGHDGVEKIKRIVQTDPNRGVFVVGDNPPRSSDSRHFGWLPRQAVNGVVVWPRVFRKLPADHV